MARRKRIDAATIRDTRDDLVSRITTQAKMIGLMPDVIAAEKFVDPILRKVEVDASSETDRAPSGSKDREHSSGEWTGEPGHSPKVPGGSEVRVSGSGPVRWDLKTNQVHAPWVKTPKESPKTAAARECFRVMRLMPEWRHLVEKVAFSTLSLKDKEQRFRMLLVQFRKLFGDPRKPLDRKISV